MSTAQPSAVWTPADADRIRALASIPVPVQCPCCNRSIPAPLAAAVTAFRGPGPQPSLRNLFLGMMPALTDPAAAAADAHEVFWYGVEGAVGVPPALLVLAAAHVLERVDTPVYWPQDTGDVLARAATDGT